MAEWSNAPVLKTDEGESPPRVRIPVPPPSASPDSTLAHNSVNYPAASAIYMLAFFVILRLRPLYQQNYNLLSEAHLARVGFGRSEILKRNAVYT